MSSSCFGSAVDAITRSTGKLPPPGSEGGVSEMMRTPENLADSAKEKERFKASKAFAKRVKEILGDAAFNTRLPKRLRIGESIDRHQITHPTNSPEWRAPFPLMKFRQTADRIWFQPLSPRVLQRNAIPSQDTCRQY